MQQGEQSWPVFALLGHEVELLGDTADRHLPSLDCFGPHLTHHTQKGLCILAECRLLRGRSQA